MPPYNAPPSHLAERLRLRLIHHGTRRPHIHWMRRASNTVRCRSWTESANAGVSQVRALIRRAQADLDRATWLRSTWDGTALRGSSLSVLLELPSQPELAIIPGIRSGAA